MDCLLSMRLCSVRTPVEMKDPSVSEQMSGYLYLDTLLPMIKDKNFKLDESQKTSSQESFTVDLAR